VVVWWGIDPSTRYPRYAERYAPLASGIHAPDGRASRTVIAVDIGDAVSAADADRRFLLPAEDEVATLSATAVADRARRPATPRRTTAIPCVPPSGRGARALAPALVSGDMCSW
jgi:formylmethanofuran dehydrogenase subunit B